MDDLRAAIGPRGWLVADDWVGIGEEGWVGCQARLSCQSSTLVISGGGRGSIPGRVSVQLFEERLFPVASPELAKMIGSVRRNGC